MPVLGIALLIGALPATGSCFASSRDIARGAPITASDVSAVPCDPMRQRASIGFDADVRAPVAVEALPAGSYLGRLLPLSSSHVTKGQKLILRSRSGPVVIERDVVAMQSAASGARVFVQDSAGKVFSVAIGVLDQ